MSETPVAFAGAGRASTETVVAFAGAGRASTETVVAFAGEKWVFLVHFSGAEVMSVSVVPCWVGSSGVVGFNVATLSRLVREKVRPARSDVGVSAKKFAQRTKNGPKLAFDGPLGEFFAETPLEGVCWAGFFAEMPLEGVCWAGFFAEMPLEGLRWANLIAIQQQWDPVGRTLRAVALVAGPSTGSANPSMRSYTRWVAWWAERPAHHPSG